MKLTLSGCSTATKETENFELDGVEKISFISLLDGQSEKTVRLERILGLGGEGIVLSDKMTTKENHYKTGWEPPIGNKETVKKGREVAVKFVKFRKRKKEDLEGPEEKDKYGYFGGIDKNEKWVKSQYFKRLEKLGDFKAATYRDGGYSRPYIDFAISKIHRNYFYVIGEFGFSFN